MSKIIKYGFEAKQAIKAGVDKAANAIKSYPWAHGQGGNFR